MKYTKQMNKISTQEVVESFHKSPIHLVHESEAEYREVMHYVCDEVIKGQTNIVLLTGPSSSGKTTTAKRLQKELTNRGQHVYRISLDNFYRPHAEMPLWNDGQKNFETVEALDIPYFNQKMEELLRNKEAEFPMYDFKTATRKEETFRVVYNKHTYIILEGIHALNPLLGEHLSNEALMRIYVSVHSDFVNADGKTILRAKNLRLMRRMLRDFEHRNTSPAETMVLWNYVRRGERIYIKPFRELADIHINSTHAYEPLIYAKEIGEMLAPYETDEKFSELVKPLLTAVKEFPTLSKSLIPEDSLIQEFI